MMARQNSIPLTIKITSTLARTLDQAGHSVRLFCISSSNKIRNLCNNLDEKRWCTTFWMQKFRPQEKQRAIMCSMNVDIWTKNDALSASKYGCVSFFGILIFLFFFFYCHFNICIPKWCLILIIVIIVMDV